MCRLLGYVSRTPVSIETAVGPSLSEFVNLSRKHCDGWGLAHVLRGSDELRIFREPEAAWQSSRLKDLTHSAQSDAAIFHLRWATPGLVTRAENTHPFVRGRYAFMHNGAIFTGIDALVPSNLSPLLEGDTDSEKYFLVVLDSVDRLGPAQGMAEAVRKIDSSCDYTSLNAMLLTPDELIVVSHYRPERIAAGEPDDYYEIRYKTFEDRILVASTGWPQEGWPGLANGAVLRIDRRTLSISAAAFNEFIGHDADQNDGAHNGEVQ